MKNTLIICAVLVMLGSLALRAYAWQGTKPLTEANLVDLLKSEVPPGRVAELAKQKGIDFELTPTAETTLRQAGADAALISTLRGLAPVVIDRVPQPGQAKLNGKDGQHYVWIPPGSFQMGCSPGDAECYDDEKPAHSVSITKGFWMGQTPVTQAAYERVKGTNPSHFKGENLPVEQVSWDEAKSYCEAAGMRLPTEAEWEYAARAGNGNARYGDLDSIAWYGNNSGNQTRLVGAKEANSWNLYDILGNVWQWTEDWYEAYDGQRESSDPAGPPSGQNRVLRGGSWSDIPQFVRVSVRNRYGPGGRYNFIGVRCVGE
jgi:formylglycine-generating enzyme required for sulfatase activity